MTEAPVIRPAALGGRAAAWLARWGPILPLLLAEFSLLAGFGAVLPVLPLYFTGHGVDIPTLGLVVAAWPAARLVAEPAFGWLADRAPRIPLMVAGLLLSALFVVAPLIAAGPIAFIVLRALAGAASAMYDPAARGYLMDATPRDRRGEAFGLYSAAQNAGFILGPAIGGVAAVVTGDVRAVFVVGALGILVAAGTVALRVRERGSGPGPRRTRNDELVAPPDPHAPRSLWNRAFAAAVLLNFGNFFAGGAWEVIWSLYMVARGGDLTWIGMTFAMFGIPILVLSPIVGRLVDRRGPMHFVVLGSVLAVSTSLLYIVVHDLPTIGLIVIVEGAGWALATPAIFAIVARGTPAGRSSTAQGVFGAAGTLGYIVASAMAGQLFAWDLAWPFYLIAALIAITFLLAIVVAGRPAFRPLMPMGPAPDGEPAPELESGPAPQPAPESAPEAA